ncbi:MAG: elongation factor P [Candidatus Kapabacteria bacterium]|nr:elongation factor P [Candidatus Kapabacteria bacterium]
MATTADLKPGIFIKFNNELCQVLESEHRTPGNLRAFYQAKMRVIRSGKLLENRFRSGETIEIVRVEQRPYQYLYRDGEFYVFMENETYEQVTIDAKIVGDVAPLMKESQDVQISFEENTPLSVELPSHVVLRITYTEPGFKGDSANNVLKPATLETGATINVPTFVNDGELIRIDTRSGEYVERVKE